MAETKGINSDTTSKPGVLLLLFLPILVALAIVAWPRIKFYLITRHFSVINKVETLQNPVAVRTWTTNGLLLADGRLIQIPGIQDLPPTSIALTELTKRGVEIASNGRICGLVRVHHWCGNDPVRNHIAKVDMSNALKFLHIGRPSGPIPEPDFTADEGGDFSQFGWNVSEFMRFNSWLTVNNAAQ